MTLRVPIPTQPAPRRTLVAICVQNFPRLCVDQVFPNFFEYVPLSIKLIISQHLIYADEIIQFVQTVFNGLSHFAAGAKICWMLEPDLELKTSDARTWSQSLKFEFRLHISGINSVHT